MKLNSAFFSSLLATGILLIATSADVWAEKQKKPERWFEVEVILFKQLNKKSELKEQFPDGVDASSLPQYRQSFDLLSPYLQPDLTRLKQFMPLCGEKDEQHLFLESLKNIKPLFPEKHQLIEQVPIFNMPDFNAIPEAFNHNELANGANQSNSQLIDTNQTVKEQNVNSKSLEIEGELELVQTENNLSEDNDSNNNEIIAVPHSEYDLQKEMLEKPIFSTKEFCIITQQEMENILDAEQLTAFNINSFDVDKVPSKLNASGLHTNNQPYLIADESLLLKDISQRLRWSKEFKPLLHFGWRQVGITQKKAIPFKLFAGEHVEYKYQQALKDYQTEISEAQAIEEGLLNELTKAQINSTTANDTVEKQPNIETNLLNKTQKYSQLFGRIEEAQNIGIDEDTISDIINSINEQNVEELLTSNTAEITSIEQSVAFSEPLQPWSLDGFIKIHLDHYLYITADFNLFNQKQKSFHLENAQKSNSKLINFSQNRRVITGEIHYFDHPYIGMIIQIRRFDPSKPKGEQVSQAIK